MVTCQELKELTVLACEEKGLFVEKPLFKTFFFSIIIIITIILPVILSVANRFPIDWSSGTN